ncbi:MAG: hypothetical protein IT497_09010 [Ottowia sp.]|nr:hypothetical protein [Ottowia sp.]
MKMAEIPVLTEIVELGSSPVTRDAVAKLLLARAHYEAALAKLEQHDFPEISARFQGEIQTQLQASAASLAESVSEQLGHILRAELRLAVQSARA